MDQQQRVIYVSRATFPSYQTGDGIEPEVGRILVQSRRNNPRRGLVGALYYADGCFFQCLEGSPAAIDAMLEILQCDPRHRDLKVLHRAPITQRSFADWSMKYVPSAVAVRNLLNKHAMATFDPYRFSQAAIDEMLELLIRKSDAGESADPHPRNAGRALGWTRGVLLLSAGVLLGALAAYFVWRC